MIKYEWPNVKSDNLSLDESSKISNFTKTTLHRLVPVIFFVFLEKLSRIFLLIRISTLALNLLSPKHEHGARDNKISIFSP